MRCGCFCCAAGHAAKNKKSDPFSFEKRFGASLIFHLEITRIALNEHKWIVYNKNCDRHLRFPTFFTGIFITLPHSSYFLPIYEKKATFR